MIRSLAVILPIEGTTILHAFGWDYFSRKIIYYDSETEENIDFMVQ